MSLDFPEQLSLILSLIVMEQHDQRNDDEFVGTVSAWGRH